MRNPGYRSTNPAWFPSPKIIEREQKKEILKITRSLEALLKLNVHCLRKGPLTTRRRCDLKRELQKTIDQLKELLNDIKISTVREEANKDIISVLDIFNHLSPNQ
ncbi:hypothetical protein C2G38_2223200 [Gigaspora rosea]|uniref:Uncharacterized protein n=1 Tax=Gigaspora rosea TaxID=44941 RepID=A0A397U376_9GLOM|nr:hypothetical protein C2G38_2223200 [Gigaspora rosea]